MFLSNHIDNFAIENKKPNYMNVKIFKKLTVTVAIIATAFSVLAEPSKTTNTKGNGSVVLDMQSHYPKTKRIPSNNFLEIVYEYGTLTLDSNCYEGKFSLSFENYETGATTEIPSIHVGECVPVILEIGEYQLTAVAEDGTELIGFMQVY